MNAFPKDLAALRQWICWRREQDEKSGRDNKTPYSPVTGRKASSTDPATWSRLEEAEAAKRRYLYTGLGFVFVKGGGLVGVDIDHCFDESGHLNEAASDILAHLPKTYIEISPSGTGLHIFLRGEMPDGGCKNAKSGVEMYAHSRYFTMTGNRYSSCTDTIAEDGGALAWIHATYIKPQKKQSRKKKRKSGAPLADNELLEKARQSGSGENFSLLWDGKWQDLFGSQSEADLSLCCKLAFWSAKNREQIDRLFRQSALYRPKWDERHTADGTTYGEETLNKAIEATENVYSPDSDAPVFQFDGRYFRAKGDKIYALTNFIVTPIEMLESEDEAQLTCDCVTTGGESYRLTFMASDFANPQKFKNVLNKRTIALSYLGGEGDLELFKSFLSELQWDIKKGVKALGIHEHDQRLMFVSGDGAVDASGNAVTDIVQLEKERSIRTAILSRSKITAAQIRELGSWLMDYNEPAKTVSVLAWSAGCFIKPHLRKSGVKFPHLFLIGEAGSGKSNTLERVVLPIFSRSKVAAASQVTAFTLMKDSASSNLIPQPLDEFKPSKMDRYKQSILYNHFRDAYDGHEGVRGRSDQQTVSYELLAPMVIAGEESADEAAVRERSVELLFSKKDLKNAEYRMAFNRLCAGEELLGSLGRSLLDTALRTSVKEAKAWHDEAAGLFSPSLPARVVNNLACCYAGLRLMEKLCGFYGVVWHEAFPLSLDACRKYLEYGAREYLFDGSDNNKTVVEQTFEVMARMNLDPNNDYDLSPDGKVLSVCLNRVYDKYTKYRRDYAILGEVLTYAQFKKQLEHSDVFLAKNVQKWIGSENRKVWQLDFAILGSRCDVSGFDEEAKPL
jgi:hypothetical protein